jgi:hypothetical protein
VQILSWLVYPDAARAVCVMTAIVLTYRLGCKKVDAKREKQRMRYELLRDLFGLGSGSRPSNAVRARHARRRRFR